MERMIEAQHVVILTVDRLPEGCSEVLGLVTAVYITSKPLLGDMLANLKNWTVGGELPGYTCMLDDAIQRLVQRVQQNAETMGATAVIGFRISTSSISAGAAEVIGYGTAVR
jgi:uncharacterized protein YbjQ (UPF0145 family)